MSWLGQGVDRAGRIAWIVALALLVVAPFLGVYPIFIAQALCFAIFAMAFNLLLGYTGLLSFGHAAFFGGAAYITAWLLQQQHLTPELALLGGVLAAAAAGLVIGAIAIRRQGIYFAMITLALAQMLFFFFLEAPFTGGEDGIQGIPRGRLFGLVSLEPDLALYYFVLSAAIAGLGGAMKTLVLHFATLQDVRWEQSGEVILMTLLGGLGTFAGPVVGAFVVVGLQNYLSDRAGAWTTVIIGAIFVLCVVAFRKGFVGELLAWQKRRANKS